jgi:hypothetical protein
MRWEMTETRLAAKPPTMPSSAVEMPRASIAPYVAARPAPKSRPAGLRSLGIVIVFVVVTHPIGEIEVAAGLVSVPACARTVKKSRLARVEALWPAFSASFVLGLICAGGGKLAAARCV